MLNKKKKMYSEGRLRLALETKGDNEVVFGTIMLDRCIFYTFRGLKRE